MKVTIIKSSLTLFLFTWLVMGMSVTPTQAANVTTIYNALDQATTTSQLPIAYDVIFAANPGATLLPEHIVWKGTAKVEAFRVTGYQRWWKIIITKVVSSGTLIPSIPANVVGSNNASAMSPSDIVTYKPNNATPSTKKYHPGHYILVNPDDSLEIATRSSNVTGVQKRYYWRTIEPVKGQYDFSVIRADLDYARQHNLYLLPFILDKTFRVNQGTPLPDYIIDDYNGEFYYAKPAEGKDVRMAKRWKPEVEERYLLLIQALGQAFDADPHLEGINLQETAAEGADADVAAEYDPIVYHANLLERLTVAAKAFPTSHVHMGINGFPRFKMNADGTRFDAGDRYRSIVFVRTMATALMRIDGIYSGPDILPFNTELNSNFGVYPVYVQLTDIMLTACSAQLDSFNHKYPKDYPNTPDLYLTDPFGDGASKAGDWLPMQRIFDFGVDKMKLNYFIWREVDPTKDPTQVDTHFQFVPDALPIINDPANLVRFPGAITRTVYLPLLTN